MWIKQKGFTIVELMVVIVVLGVFAAIAMPNFRTMIVNSRASTLGDDLLYAFSYARSEAVKRGEAVSVCVSNDGKTCTGETDWKVGYIVFRDTAASDTTATPTLAAVTDVLRVWQSPSDKAQILVKRNNVDVSFFRFTGLGVLARNDPSPVVVSSSIENCIGDAARTVRINLAGQVRSEKTACP